MAICNVSGSQNMFRLQTVKIQVLNDNSFLEVCWPLEVFEANI
jgi:hypothetical protein